MRAPIFPYTSRIPRSLVILLSSPFHYHPEFSVYPSDPGKKRTCIEHEFQFETPVPSNPLSLRKTHRLVYLNNNRTELGGGNTICQHSCIYTGSRWTSSVNHSEWARNNWPRCSPVHRYVGDEHPDGQNMFCHKGCRMHVVGVE